MNLNRVKVALLHNKNKKFPGSVPCTQNRSLNYCDLYRSGRYAGIDTNTHTQTFIYVSLCKLNAFTVHQLRKSQGDFPHEHISS